MEIQSNISNIIVNKASQVIRQLSGQDFNLAKLHDITEYLLKNFRDPQEISTLLSYLYDQSASTEVQNTSLLLANLQLLFTETDKDYYHSTLLPLAKVDKVLYSLVSALHAIKEDNNNAHFELLELAKHSRPLLEQTLTTILDRNTTNLGQALRVLYMIDKEKAKQYADSLVPADEFSQDVVSQIKEGYETTPYVNSAILNQSELAKVQELFSLAINALSSLTETDKSAVFDHIQKLPEKYSLPILVVLLNTSDFQEQDKILAAIQGVLTTNNYDQANLHHEVIKPTTNLKDMSLCLAVANDVYDLICSMEKYSDDLLYKYCVKDLTTNNLEDITLETNKAYSDLKLGYLKDYIKILDELDPEYIKKFDDNFYKEILALQDKIKQITSGSQLDEATINTILSDQVLQNYGALTYQMSRNNWTFLILDPRLMDPTSYVKRSSTSERVRIYINSDPNLIPNLAQELLESSVLKPFLHSVKLIDFNNKNLSDFDRMRSERLTIYLDKEGLEIAKQVLKEWYDRNPIVAEGDFHLPLFTEQIMPGVSIGEEPKNNALSFSQTRAALLVNMGVAVVEKLLREETIKNKDSKLFQIFKTSVENSTDNNEVDATAIIDALTNPLANEIDKRDVRQVIKLNLPNFIRLINKEEFSVIALDAMPIEAKALGIDPSNLSRNLSNL